MRTIGAELLGSYQAKTGVRLRAWEISQRDKLSGFISQSSVAAAVVNLYKIISDK